MINNSARFITRLLRKREVLITRDMDTVLIYPAKLFESYYLRAGGEKNGARANSPFRLLRISPLRREACASCIISAINVS